MTFEVRLADCVTMRALWRILWTCVSCGAMLRYECPGPDDAWTSSIVCSCSEQTGS